MPMNPFLRAVRSPFIASIALIAAISWSVSGEPRPFTDVFVLPDARLDQGPVGICAHRGLNRYAPENTYASAALCVELGFPYVEVDVRTTSDGVLVVLHDETVDRTTDGSGRVDAMSWEEVSRLDAGSWFGPAYAGQRVPKLSDFLAWSKGKIDVYLDVKDADAAALLAAVRSSGMHDRVFLWSRDRDFMRAVRSLDSTIAIKLNPKNDSEIKALGEELTPALMEFDRKTFSPERVSKVTELGYRPMLYTNRDEPELFRAALNAGVELFNIDYVESFAAIAREQQLDE